MKKITKTGNDIVGTALYNMERLEFNQNNQITPFVLNWNFKLYIEEEYIKNMDFFFLIKEEASDKEVKCRFNKIFIDQSR